jgi:hypothetical protein
MSKFTSAASTGFRRTRLFEAVAEAGMAVAAAGFTAAVWFSVGALAFAPDRSTEAPSAASQPRSVTHVTLPPVVIVGRRDSLEGTPVATTAENTAAIPVTLKR